MTLFRRTYRVTIGSLRVTAPMRIAFEIERTTRPQPSKATVKVWNLTRSHQREIEQAATAQVVVEAGYLDDRGPETLFVGELFRSRGRTPPTARTELAGVDAITEIEARDGGRAFQRARVEQSFEPGVSVETVLRAIARSLGVGEGNLDQVAALAEVETGGSSYPEGLVLSGQASRELTRILRGLGLGWSVQHGRLQILRRGQALQTQAVRLTPETGLVGSPDVGTRGRVTVRSLLTPALWPGRLVVIESRRVKGNYRCRSVKYTGDSHAADWHAECELEPLEAA